ncbi:NADPH-dependent F420 reductase [Corynebacterium glyciniphilum]|uniref:NADPH-dependent F420 reductase n=1 Tax=Corynebacterium glyciniphilum TaxID=1404244 RepID=UPI003DA0E33A
MNIGIIGAGSLGGAVGRALAAGGHDIVLSSRHPERLREEAPRITTSTIDGCVRTADLLLLSTPYRVLPEISRQLRPLLAERNDDQRIMVLDATNPSPGADSDEISQTAYRDGMGITTQKYLPDARVVRAFSSVNAGEITRSRSAAQPLAIPVAGDDPAAVDTAAQLVRDAGCAPVVTGDMSTARKFEWGNPGCLVHTDEHGMRRVLEL